MKYDDPDECYKKLLDLRQNLDNFENIILTETDTRCKMIDLIFKDVLGWDEANITRESSVKSDDGTEYIDYIFKSNTNSFIIEAKRNSLYFNIPKHKNKLAINGVITKDKTTKCALEQAYNYCNKIGIHAGAICNGYQFVIFTIGIKNVYIFNNIDEIIEKFNIFFNMFSPYSNIEMDFKTLMNSLDNEVRAIPQYSKSLIQENININETINRNPMDKYIYSVIEKFFSDIDYSKDESLANKLYCSDNRIENYEQVLKSLLIDEIPNLDIFIQDSTNFAYDFLNAQKNNIKEIERPSKTLLIVGGVGAGKTTFINKFFNTKLPEEVKKNLIWLYIDCKKVSDDKINVQEFIYKNCLEQIREKYSFLRIDDWDILQEIYELEITRRKKGSLKPIYESNRKEFDFKISEMLTEKISNEIQFSQDVLKYLGKKLNLKKTVCLIIDNADQLSQEFQKKAFLEAQAFNENYNSLSIISLREETYWSFHKVKPFDAYVQHAYHIVAPSVSKMIKKRLDTAITNVRNEQVSIYSPNGIEVKIKIKQFLEILKESLFNGNNPSEATKFIEAISVKDLRTATKMLTAFLTSGHTNTKEYISIYLNQGSYVIPYHAIVRSVALGDYKYYKSDRSILPNIFLIEEDGFYSHFTILRILQYMRRRVNVASYVSSGYVNVNEMHNDFKEIYPSNTHFRNILDTMLKNRMIMANNGYNISGQDAEYVKLSSAGYYILENLLYEFAYLERLCEDTPITKLKYFEELQKKTNEINDAEAKQLSKHKIINLRLERIDIFLAYLKECEQEDLEYIITDKLQYRFIDNIISRYNAQKRNIIYSLKNYK